MIKLIANITVERLRDKTTTTEGTKTTPTGVANGSPVATVKATHTGLPVTEPANKPSRPIDLGELRSRLQNAYRTPLPKITVSSLSCGGHLTM